MGELLQTFTFDRNTVKRTAEESAETVVEHIRLALEGASLIKVQSNIVGALSSYMGVLSKREDDVYDLTSVGEVFQRLYQQNRPDAWRWLVTRSLWRYVVPNGTASPVNAAARNAGLSFSFFRLLLGLLTHLGAHPGNERYLYYDELCAILNDDSNWGLDAHLLYQELLNTRAAQQIPLSKRQSFLGDLETDYRIGRDNFNTLFNKLFFQTDLFEYVRKDRKFVGIAIASDLDNVLRRRIRFVLDHPVGWDSEQLPWLDFLQYQTPDLPEEVSLLPAPPPLDEEPLPPAAPVAIEEIVTAAVESFRNANFVVTPELIQRFVAALLAKRFLILTGLSGSGKTKLAQAFAAWITSTTSRKLATFAPGSEIKAQQITYYVNAADQLAVELRNSTDEDQATKVVLPQALISEWIECIREQGFTRNTPARTIREMVAETTKYSTQLNSFETHLKAAAFAVLETRQDVIAGSGYEVVAVGADWTSNEHILGYADALDPSRYERTRALDLMLRARDNPTLPHFLILDEMNLSHVERYFADLLSAIESGEPMWLHGSRDRYGETQARDGVPALLDRLPPNLFVLGTVNVDETTYMFSPKVLDRGNVIEFRINEIQMESFLDNPQPINLEELRGAGSAFAHSFVTSARSEPALQPALRQKLKAEMMLFFRVLSHFNAEFGFRSSREITRFVAFHQMLSRGTWEFGSAMDAQISQKLLPRLHGSREKLEPILCALSVLCREPREWLQDNEIWYLANMTDLVTKAKRAAALADDALYPLNENGESRIAPEQALYSMSYKKIVRMLGLLLQNNFTSFAEA